MREVIPLYGTFLMELLRNIKRINILTHLILSYFVSAITIKLETKDIPWTNMWSFTSTSGGPVFWFEPLYLEV